MAKKLLPWCEAIGKVEDVRVESEEIVLRVEDVGEITIGAHDKNFISRLKNLQGQKVAILHTDIPGHEYVLRKLT